MSNFAFFYPIFSFSPSTPGSYGFYQPNMSSPLFSQLSSFPFESPSNFTQLQNSQSVSAPLKEDQSRGQRNSQKTVNVAKKCRKMRRKERKLIGDQKENRNVLSNILRNFFRKVSDYARIEKMVTKIILRYHLHISTQDFFEFLQKLKVDHSRYIRIKSVKQYFINPQMECSILLRVLFKHYSDEEGLLQTLTSRKIGRQSIKCHLEGIQDLMQRLFRSC